MNSIQMTAGQSGKRFNRAALLSHGLRQGMWVSTDCGVGILTECGPSSAAVMLVNEDGTNRIEVPANPFLLRQAAYFEIPTPRRPDAEKARKLNYKMN